MPLEMSRIQRMPVTQNSKCESCAHYDGNVSKAGACEVGTQPAMCGDGAVPKYGYAPLEALSPDEIDDIATPMLVGSQGAMNEFGELEATVKMQRVVLGDEDLGLAQRILGNLNKSEQITTLQGEIGAHVPSNEWRLKERRPSVMYRVAKSLYDNHFAPRKQKKFSIGDVLAFLQENGMPVTEEDRELAKSTRSHKPNVTKAVK